MILDLHPDIRIQKLTIGTERAPLLVVDNFVADPEKLVRRAATKSFTAQSSHYPGIRAEAPLGYQQLFERKLKELLFEYFSLQGRSFKFPMCHYSLVTTPPDQLVFLQRVPHIDSAIGNGLASIHYLFKGSHGGTAFYRHRQTGFEYIDESRKERYFKLLELEKSGPHSPGPEYINGDTRLFEQIGYQEGIFNRLLVYRRNSLHSGSVGKDFVPDSNPRTGRLSINSFIDLIP
jgi:hypothetical protein